MSVLAYTHTHTTHTHLRMYTKNTDIHLSIYTRKRRYTAYKMISFIFWQQQYHNKRRKNSWKFCMVHIYMWKAGQEQEGNESNFDAKSVWHVCMGYGVSVFKREVSTIQEVYIIQIQEYMMIKLGHGKLYLCYIVRMYCILRVNYIFILICVCTVHI